MNSEERPETAVSVFSVGMAIFLLWISLFIGLVRQDPGLTAVSLGGLLFSHGGRLWARLAVRRLDFTIALDRVRLFPGEVLTVTAVLRNDKVLPVRVRFRLGMAGDGAITDGLGAATRLLSYEERIYRWPVSVTRRGVFRLGRAQTYAGDLTGLHERSVLPTGNPGAGEVVVYPRVRPVRSVEVSFQEYFGIRAARGPVDDPAWYAGTREYQGLRPARHIHWKTSARLGTLQEKLYEPTSHRKVLFVLDVRGYRGEEARGAFETAIEAAASLAAVFVEQGASVGLVTNGIIPEGRYRYLSLGRGPEHLGVLLEILARLELKEGEDLVRLVSQAGRSGTGYVYVGYGPDGVEGDFFGLPSARRERVLFLFSRKETGGEGEDAAAVESSSLSRKYPVLCVEDVFHD